MKNKLIATTVAAFAMLLAAPAADARGYRGAPPAHHHHSHVFISGYHRCGTPIYTERYLVRYDRHRRPVYGYRVIHHRPHFVRQAPRGYYVAPACPPPVRSGGHITIRF